MLASCPCGWCEPVRCKVEWPSLFACIHRRQSHRRQRRGQLAYHPVSGCFDGSSALIVGSGVASDVGSDVATEATSSTALPQRAAFPHACFFLQASSLLLSPHCRCFTLGMSATASPSFASSFKRFLGRRFFVSCGCVTATSRPSRPAGLGPQMGRLLHSTSATSSTDDGVASASSNTSSKVNAMTSGAKSSDKVSVRRITGVNAACLGFD